uniref:Uncharacterized protein n=1 Tax=Aegilops tauschii subsp. strangulata TaxID=200361 RepID=A0A453FIF7_AEGTS
SHFNFFLYISETYGKFVYSRKKHLQHSESGEEAGGGGSRRGDEKMGGGMEVNKNRWIEEWNAGRENLELNFRFTRRSLAVIGLFGLAVPILVYKGIVREFHMQDEDAGRPYRKFL